MADLGIGFDWSRDRNVFGIGAFIQTSPSPGGFVSQRRVMADLEIGLLRKEGSGEPVNSAYLVDFHGLA